MGTSNLLYFKGRNGPFERERTATHKLEISFMLWPSFLCILKDFARSWVFPFLLVKMFLPKFIDNPFFLPLLWNRERALPTDSHLAAWTCQCKRETVALTFDSCTVRDGEGPANQSVTSCQFTNTWSPLTSDMWALLSSLISPWDWD